MVVDIGMLVVAVLSLCLAAIATWYARGTAAAAKAQVETQLEIAREAAQPYVWADIRPNPKQESQLMLVVGNSGQTIATNIKVRVDRDLPTTNSRLSDLLEPAIKRFQSGHASLAPGRTNAWMLGVSHEILDDPQADLRFKFHVAADGPYGAVPEQVYDVDLNDWRSVGDYPDGSLHYVRKAIDGLTAETKKLGGDIRSLRPESSE